MLRFRISPYFYKRFINDGDGVGIWAGGEEELKQFAEHANSIHPNIQVEPCYHRKQIEFLDTLFKLEDGHVYTDLYVKPSDKQLYRNSSSCHPPNTKKGLAGGFAKRRVTIYDTGRS